MPTPFHVPAAALEAFGRDLHRPECVIPTPDGVLVSDWRGGVTLLRHDGSQQTWLAENIGFALRPNGIGHTPEGAFVIAHLGETGGVFALSRAGLLTPLVTEIDGRPLPPTNFAIYDATGRLWISVSTRHEPRQLAWRPHIADGFIAVADRRGTRIVADGLHYTNEVRPDPSGQYLYAIETFGRRLVRFPIAPDGTLGAKETVVTLGHGCFPDGFAFDAQGGIWITSLVSNRILRYADGTLQTVVEDINEAFVEDVERAFADGTMAAGHLGPIPGTRLQHATSIGFGGANLEIGYIGSLHTSCIYRFAVPNVRR